MYDLIALFDCIQTYFMQACKIYARKLNVKSKTNNRMKKNTENE